MKLSQFNKPEEHPCEMLAHLPHACEKESFMWWMLLRCFEIGEFCPVETKNVHHDMVVNGLLIDENPDSVYPEMKRYSFTIKAKGLLYSVYGKE